VRYKGGKPYRREREIGTHQLLSKEKKKHATSWETRWTSDSTGGGFEIFGKR